MTVARGALRLLATCLCHYSARSWLGDHRRWHRGRQMKRDMLQKLAVPGALGVAVDSALLEDGAAEAAVEVETCERPSEAVLAEWDRLVAAAKDSDITQLSGWATVRRTAGYEPLYVFARQAGTL